MPRPPILPLLDWPAIFASGLPYADWIRRGESEENRRKIVQAVADQPLTPRDQERLRALGRPVHVVVIAEDWCGDVVRHAPVLERLALACDELRVRYLARAQHPDVFARFLTNGGEAIPKLVFLNDRFVECGNWGPMPARCRELIARGKACGDVPAARKQVAELYARDPGKRDVIGELLDLLEIAAAPLP
jgi:hypothetical protein